MARIFTNTKIDFVSKRVFCYCLSGILIVMGFVSFQKNKADAFGIDFAGGLLQEYRFSEPIHIELLRSALGKAGLGDAVIQQFENAPENIIIRTARTDEEDETIAKVSSILKNTFPGNGYDTLRVEQVGPIVGKALRKHALLAMVCALGAILIFVGFRFKHFDFATAGVVALLHDVLLSFLILIMLGRQIDLLVVTALLTIAGYSINDTIIIYDRVRENMLKTPKGNLSDIINLSINQTLGRTILTTITTLLVVITLFFKGGEVLNSFALCLLIGFVLGTYSTIFIASPLVLAWQKKPRIR